METRNEGAPDAVYWHFCFLTENARLPQVLEVRIAAVILAAVGVLLPGRAIALAPTGAGRLLLLLRLLDVAK